MTKNPETDKTWYHGTTSEFWAIIQKEGVLWGRQDGPSRCTYLAADKEEAACYGNIVLEVEYVPGSGTDNYVPDCWQMRVYDPIPLDRVKVVSDED